MDGWVLCHLPPTPNAHRLFLGSLRPSSPPGASADVLSAANDLWSWLAGLHYSCCCPHPSVTSQEEGWNAYTGGQLPPVQPAKPIEVDWMVLNETAKNNKPPSAHRPPESFTGTSSNTFWKQKLHCRNRTFIVSIHPLNSLVIWWLTCQKSWVGLVDSKPKSLMLLRIMSMIYVQKPDHKSPACFTFSWKAAQRRKKEGVWRVQEMCGGWSSW